MELRKFRNQYDLELISAPYADMICGMLVWDPLAGKTKLDHRGMPDNIFNAFLDATLVDESQWQGYLDQSKAIELSDAGLAQKTIDADVDVMTTLKHPKIGQIENSIAIESIKKFSFGALQVRSMPQILRVRIDDFIEQLRAGNWEKYDGSIRRVFIITQLWYGSVQISIEKSVAAQLEADGPADLDLSNKLELSKSIEYTFDHENVPFAMRIERVRDFNG